MQQYRLANYVDEYTYRAHLVPINSEYGFHGAMASLPNLSTFKRVEDYQAYISRLNALKPYFDQQIAYMKQALKGMPSAPIEQPEGLVSVRIDRKTGLLSRQSDNSSRFEYFLKDSIPTQYSQEAVPNLFDPYESNDMASSEDELF